MGAIVRICGAPSRSVRSESCAQASAKSPPASAWANVTNGTPAASVGEAARSVAAPNAPARPAATSASSQMRGVAVIGPMIAAGSARDRRTLPGRVRAVTDDQLEASLRKMRDDGVSDAGVATFAHYFERLREGEAGELAESEIEPVDDLPDAGELPADDEGARDALARTVVIKLNGGLGTSMGMTGPKSLLEVKDGLTFLDVVVRQILHLRERTGARLPLVLMNSFATREPSLAALERYPELAVDGDPARLRAEQGAEAAARTTSHPSSGRTIPRSNGRRPGTATSTRRC